MGAGKYADDHFRRVWRVSHGLSARCRWLPAKRDRRRLRSRGPLAQTLAGKTRRLSHSIRSRPDVLDGGSLRLEIAGPAAGAVARGFAGRVVADARNAVSPALRQSRISCAAVLVAV